MTVNIGGHITAVTVGALMLSCYGCDQSPEASTSEETYNSPEWHYSVTVPAGWSRQTGGNNKGEITKVIHKGDGKGDVYGLELSVEKLQLEYKNFKVDKLADAYISGFNTMGSRTLSAGKKGQTKVSGLDAAWITHAEQNEDVGKPVDGTMYFIKTRTLLYSFDIKAVGDGAFTRHKTELEGLINGLKIEHT